MSNNRQQINGAEATLADLALIAQLNYGHFTSLQVRDRCAKGFELHLERLADATRTLFGCALDVVQTREWIRQILDDQPASLRVTVFSRALDRTRLERPAGPDVLVAASPGREPHVDPLRVRTTVYERELPAIKHVGTFGLFHHLRQARMEGWDDVLFTTPAGEISEGSIWNIGLWDGQHVVWPAAPALDGVSRRLLDAALKTRGIPVEVRAVHKHELRDYRAAFTTNSGAVGRPVAQIDDIPFHVHPEFSKLLNDAYASCAWETI